MKSFFKKRPVLSYLLLTFFVTYLFWFLPVFVDVPIDVSLGLSLIGGCGPLLAGYLIMVSNSNAKIKVHSIPIFVIVFFIAVAVLMWRISTLGETDAKERNLPTLNQISWVGYILFAIAFLVLGLNASNATNKQLKENHISSFLPERGKLKWYLLGFVLIPFLSLVGYGAGMLIGAPLTEIFINIKLNFLLGFLATFLFFGGNEEFGWRGFMQKEMQKKQSPLIAALVISFFWSLWHLPLHYNGFYGTGGFVELLPRFVWTIPITIIYTWLYNKSKYALLAVMILHATMNNVSSAFGTSELIYFILTILVAIYFVISDKMWKKRSFVPGPSKNVEH